MSFEGQPAQGSQAITQKLTSLPFQQVRQSIAPAGLYAFGSPESCCPSCKAPVNLQVKHHITSTDAQPSTSGGLLVFVTGQILVGASATRHLPDPFHCAAAWLQPGKVELHIEGL